MTSATTLRTVGDLMSPAPVVVRDDAPIGDALKLLDTYRFHGLPVVDAAGALVGVLSQTDLVRARATESLWSRVPGLRVRHLMTAPPLTVGADADLIDAARRMEAEQVHRLVVVGTDQRIPIGIVSTSDLVRAMAEEIGEAPRDS